MVFLIPFDGADDFGNLGRMAWQTTLAGADDFRLPGRHFSGRVHSGMVLPALLPTLFAPPGRWRRLGIMTVANTLSQRVVARWAGAGTLLFLLWHIAPDYRFDGKTWSRLKYPNLRGLLIEVERCGRAVNQMLLPDEPFYASGYGTRSLLLQRPPARQRNLLGGPAPDGSIEGTNHAEGGCGSRKTQPPLILVENFAYLQPPPNHPVRVWISQHYVRSPEARFSRLFAVYLRRDSDLAFRISTNQQPFVLTLADVDPVFLRLTSHELLQTGRVREAMGYLQKVMEIAPGHPEDDNDLAWLLATGPMRTSGMAGAPWDWRNTPANSLTSRRSILSALWLRPMRRRGGFQRRLRRRKKPARWLRRRANRNGRLLIRSCWPCIGRTQRLS